MLGVKVKAALSRSFCSTATLRDDAVRLSQVHTLTQRERRSNESLSLSMLRTHQRDQQHSAQKRGAGEKGWENGTS
jgi:hypothetical protein